MRKYVSGVVSALVALTGLAAFGAAAPFESLKVHIPEAVHIAQNELPAGDYTVRYVNGGSDVPFLSFQSKSGQTVVVAAMRNQLMLNDTPEKSFLVFDKTAGELSLARVQVEGLRYSYEILGSHAHAHTIVAH